MLVGLAAAIGGWVVADGFLGSPETFSSARELADTAARNGVRCQGLSFTNSSASCLVGDRFTAFRVFDTRTDKRDMIQAIKVVRREGGGGNHLVIGDRWAIITVSKGVAHRLGAALGGRVDLVGSRHDGDGSKKKR